MRAFRWQKQKGRSWIGLFAFGWCSGVYRSGGLNCRSCDIRRHLLRSDICCVKALRTLQDIEHDCLPSFECPIAFHLDGGVVGEQVLITAVCYDETVTLALLNHLTLPLSMLLSLCKGVH